MKVYIAAPYKLKDKARHIREVLNVKAHIGCTSRWIDEESTISDEWAQKDLADVSRADALVLLNPEGWEEKGTGGRWVEVGFAIARAKPVLVIGERSNIFCHLSFVRQIDELQDFVKAVQGLIP